MCDVYGANKYRRCPYSLGSSQNSISPQVAEENSTSTSINETVEFESDITANAAC